MYVVPKVTHYAFIYAEQYPGLTAENQQQVSCNRNDSYIFGGCGIAKKE
jgi:hypothetical protein